MVQQNIHEKKHPCPDCTFCQWCGDDRCRMCRGEGGAGKRKLSLDEQIALYESLNRGEKTPAESP